MRFDSIVSGICLCGVMLSGVPAAAQEVAVEVLLKEEYNEKNSRINEMFQEKIAKISERVALPEEMRALLIGQADEVREFDVETLKRKLDMKIRQAKERDDLKERLRQDSQNRMKWLMQDEAMFQRNKNKKQAQQPGNRPEEAKASASPDAAAPVSSRSESTPPAAAVAVPAENASAVPGGAVQPAAAAVPEAAPAVSAKERGTSSNNRKNRGRYGKRNSRRPADAPGVSETLAKETTTFSKQGDAVIKTNETVVVRESQPVVNPDGSVTKAEEIIAVKTQETVDPSAVPVSAAPAAAAAQSAPVSAAPAAPAAQSAPVSAAPAAPAAQPVPAPAVMDEDMIIMEDSPLIRASEEAFVVDAVAEQNNTVPASSAAAPVSK